MEGDVLKQGAEAKIYVTNLFGKKAVAKERFSKKYRHPHLDATILRERTKSEVRCLRRCREKGIPTPAIYWVDSYTIYMEHIESVTVKCHLMDRMARGDSMDSCLPLAAHIGRNVAKMHSSNIIHGDLTTSNMLLRKEGEGGEEGCSKPPVMIDFGLGYVGTNPEDKGVDLYVLERALLSTHPDSKNFFEEILKHYVKEYGSGSKEVIKRFEDVRLRGRKRTMVG